MGGLEVTILYDSRV